MTLCRCGDDDGGERRSRESSDYFTSKRDVCAMMYVHMYDRPKPLTNMWYFLALNAVSDVDEIPVAF